MVCLGNGYPVANGPFIFGPELTASQECVEAIKKLITKHARSDCSVFHSSTIYSFSEISDSRLAGCY